MFTRRWFPSSWFDPQWFPQAGAAGGHGGGKVGGRHVVQMMLAYRAAKKERDRQLLRRALQRVEAEEAADLVALFS